MIEKESLIKAYIRLKELYLHKGKDTMRNKSFRMVHNPVKTSFELAGTRECILKSTNVMCASLEGRNITKVISIDDVAGLSRETVVYTDKYLNTLICNDIGLTTLRCGIMAVLSADLNFNITKNTKVGFIGNGSINQSTFEVLNILFGIKDCIIRGSKKNRAKNRARFKNISGGSVTADCFDDCRMLNECDIVFCCTSSYKKEDMISHDKLSNPSVIVVQDGGYILDESFRKGFGRRCYTDHEEQLHQHYRSEFPHDKKRRRFATMKNTRKSSKKKAIYLYGVAIADLIVFEEFFKGR